MIKINNCAIYGGTFDPIHNGHIFLIDALLAAKKFEKFIVVPAGDPWQKEPNVPARQRVEMVRLALVGRDLEISEVEVNRTGPSYALDTVTELHSEFSAQRYTWVLGSDAFAQLDSWYRIEELAKLVEFLVIKRPGSAATSARPNFKYETLEIAALDISASEVRRKISAHENYEELLPASVVNYIKEHGLYGAA